LLDPLFPRSAFFSLRLAEHSLERLMTSPADRAGRTPVHCGCAPAVGALLESLEDRLATLQATCRDVAEAIAMQFFRPTKWVAWSDAGHSSEVGGGA
ncbi:MAG: alpha-E domain-containing protein, partial [Mycobacterium sp.]|nr:alpha-E domain-containing protein [Mycobacterium sp.]